MKRLKYLLLGVLMITPILGSYTKETAPTTIRYTTAYETSVTLQTLTVYNPVKRQCDKTPLITASNARIDVARLKSRQLRWIALSRNLLKRWKGAFQYGDTVNITTGDPEIDGEWIIQDTLNKRYKNAGDLLFDSNVRKLGKWKNVKISRIHYISVDLPAPIPE